MALDPTKNFLKETLASGYSLSATAITLPDASRFPNPAVDGAFNIVWWNVTDYPDPADDPSKEIVRVTAISGSIATITRAQEGTTATAKNLSGKTYQIALALTKKTMDDIDTALETVAGDISTLETRIDTAEGDITQIEADLGVVEGDIASLQSGKQDALGFTPENVANKENTTLDTSTTKYPTNRLVKEGLDAKQNTLLFTPENIANKSTDVSADGSSDTKYPSVKAIKDYADDLVIGAVNYRSGYDASVNTFPTTGGSGTAGAVRKGNMWIISVAGTLGGEAVSVGDSIIANVNTPGQTASNWNILNSNITYVPEDVANKATSVTGNESSDVKYPSVKSVYDWATGLLTPQARTITINGVTQDLSTNRTWTVTVPTITAGTGITDSSGTFSANISTGVSGGQSIYGGTASGNNLTIYSTSHATKGKILFGTSAYNEVNNRLGIGTTTPVTQFQVTGSVNTSYVEVSSGVGIQSNSSGSGLVTAMAFTPADPVIGISNGANFGFNGSGNNFYGIGLAALRNSAYDMWFQTGNGNGGGYRWYTGTTERMTMDKNGNIGIGTTAPPTNPKLAVVSGSITGSGASDSTIQLRHATENVGHSTAIEFTFGNGNNSYCGSRIVGETANGGGGNLHFQTGSSSLGTYSTKMYIAKAGNVGIGTTSPTAMLHIKAGTASANTAPLKFTTGTNLTTAEAGAMEYNNTPHFTNSDATRRHIVLSPSATKTTAGTPYTNDGYITLNIGGTDVNVMTTA